MNPETSPSAEPASSAMIPLLLIFHDVCWHDVCRRALAPGLTVREVSGLYRSVIQLARAWRLAGYLAPDADTAALLASVRDAACPRAAAPAAAAAGDPAGRLPAWPAGGAAGHAADRFAAWSPCFPFTPP